MVADLLDVVRRRLPHVVEAWAPVGDDDAAPDELLGVWYWGPSPYAVAASATPGLLTLAPLGGAVRTSRLDLRGPAWVGRGGYFDGEPLVVRRDAAGAVTHLELASFVFTRQPYEPPGVIPGGVEPR